MSGQEFYVGFVVRTTNISDNLSENLLWENNLSVCTRLISALVDLTIAPHHH
jgi:hypothetical protein